ncbi:CAF17-like 4Fe-4S cluster assembly/insertion protein YgfZ [Polynucleobacter sp. HIN7]|uniref:CAF17-like 4Fe-4S cluster assembly/insertion protein YgfZ n=1 Tax=Polynucleobacter sp. HIN7 TaxID=3047866 RepID=UPI00257444F3|nr:folate-binding protein [Polynucleobacter sp. HIN7]BEI37206.1 folate-binding protein YgfZ [Polynucleobacter sp. HIN7]
MNPPTICRLPDWGLILVEGPDASSFLQGQLTNSVLGLTTTPTGGVAHGSSAVRLTGYCTAKGRLLASAWISLHSSQTATQYALFVSRDLASAFAKRLSMFVLRSKVTIRDASDDWLVYGSLETIEGLLPRLPADAIALAMQSPGDTNPTKRIVFASQMTVDAQLNSSEWNAAEVASGIPRIVAATQDQFVPQMVNLESVGGVDFKKGCYPGQEVVARSQYRGAIKRRLYLAKAQIPSESCLPATEIFHEEDPGQPAGMVVLSAPNSNNPDWIDLQIECKSELAQSGKLHLGDASGPSLELGKLPYSLVEI